VPASAVVVEAAPAGGAGQGGVDRDHGPRPGVGYELEDLDVAAARLESLEVPSPEEGQPGFPVGDPCEVDPDAERVPPAFRP
jgi:hypothetical protein